MKPPIVIVGGGFAGAMTAVHLAAAGEDVTVVEPGELGRGVAYARHATDLLLNTPAPAMSAFPDRPAHFVDWLGDPTIRFAPRARYGDYLESIIAAHPIPHVRARALDVARDGRDFAIRCDDGTTRAASAVVLALGNAAPRRPDHRPDVDTAYVGDPYSDLTELATTTGPVALLGTGLTALDVVTRLRAHGHAGRILMASRRGLAPISHAPVSRPTALPARLVRQPSLALLLAWWRDAELRDIEPIARVDALRPHLPTLWRRLPDRDRARFVRHVRPHWEVIRHRAPPQVHAVLARGLADGSIELIPGGLAALAGRGAAALINCTGPDRDLARSTSPLVHGLLARGLIERDRLGLGCVTDADGLAAPGVHVVGPWRVAGEWESTAVPELRVQAAALAARIAAPQQWLRTSRLAATTRA